MVLAPRAGVSLCLWVLLCPGLRSRTMTPKFITFSTWRRRVWPRPASGAPCVSTGVSPARARLNSGTTLPPALPTHCPVLVCSCQGQISDAEAWGSGSGLAGNPGEAAGGGPLRSAREGLQPDSECETERERVSKLDGVNPAACMSRTREMGVGGPHGARPRGEKRADLTARLHTALSGSAGCRPAGPWASVALGSTVRGEPRSHPPWVAPSLESCLPLQGVLWVSRLFAEQDSPVWLDHGLFNHDPLKDVLVVPSLGPLQMKPLGALVCRFACEQQTCVFQDIKRYVNPEVSHNQYRDKPVRDQYSSGGKPWSVGSHRPGFEPQPSSGRLYSLGQGGNDAEP